VGSELMFYVSCECLQFKLCNTACNGTVLWVELKEAMKIFLRTC
jgi:hypothetical protein